MEIDFTQINAFLALPPDQMLLRFLILFGWIPILVVVLWGFKEIWMNYIQEKWLLDKKFILLAIDIPKENTQSPRAVENIFTYLAGAHSSPDLIDKYWDGYTQLGFSLEVVSIDGYSQFLIHTPEIFRNLIESAVYSQYPDAEITEVNDYTKDMPGRFPDDEYDMWGGEFCLANNYAYPIKTYEEFIHQMGAPEEHFNDPMASLMDMYSSLVPGEQAWFQIIVTPRGFNWTKAGDSEIGKILGEKKSSNDLVDKITKKITNFLWEFSEIIIRLGGESDAQKEDDSLKMFNLKPKEKKQMEAIQRKMSKIGLEFKTRFVYVAKKDVFNKAKVVSGFVGFIKQFADLDLNNLKPDKYTTTAASYFFTDSRVNSRKIKLMNNYKNRESQKGGKTGILNIEELATLWHFPVEAVVKAPLIQKTPGKKAEPPITLPIGEEVVSEELFTNIKASERKEFFDQEGGFINEENKREKKKNELKKEIKDEIFSGDLSKVETEKDILIPKSDTLQTDSIQVKKNIDTNQAEKKGSPPADLPFG